MTTKDIAPGDDLGRGPGATGVYNAQSCLYFSKPYSFCQASGLGHVLRLRDKAIALGHDAIRRELEKLALCKLLGGHQ